MMVPKIYWSLKKRVVAFTGRAPRVVSRLGFRWLLDPSDWLDMQFVIGRAYEVPQLDYLIELCRRYGVRQFCDCGSNFGLYSVVLPSRVESLERLDAFEPLSRVRWRLIANLGLNGLYGRTQIHSVALSDKSETNTLAVDPRSSGISSLSPNEEELGSRHFTLQEEISCVRLDDYLDKPLFPMALKIDVEGHEISALTGMGKTLRANPCVVQVETRTRNRDQLIALMQDYGYRKIHEIGGDLYFLSSTLADH